MNAPLATNDDAGPPSVNTDISDLFFNRDLDEAEIRDVTDGKRQFVGWNSLVLADEARTMLGNLERLGVTDLPTAENLVEDFLGRI
jgi:hypothetical protein